jgi:hypothetical protein
LIWVFKKKLQFELLEGIDALIQTGSLRPTHKSKAENRSFESIASAISVSTAGGSVDCEGTNNEEGRYERRFISI